MIALRPRKRIVVSTADISIVVCTFNRAKMLRDSLESLICQETDGKFSFEILVIDNGSMDGTSHAIAEVGAHSVEWRSRPD